MSASAAALTLEEIGFTMGSIMMKIGLGNVQDRAHSPSNPLSGSKFDTCTDANESFIHSSYDGNDIYSNVEQSSAFLEPNKLDLMEELFVLSIKAQAGEVDNLANKLFVSGMFSAALLCELFARRLIFLQTSRQLGPFEYIAVVPSDYGSRSVDGDLLDEAMSLIKERGQIMGIGYWMKVFSDFLLEGPRIKNIIQRVGSKCVQKEVVHEVKKRKMLVYNKSTYPIREPEVRVDLEERIRRFALYGQNPGDQRELLLVSLFYLADKIMRLAVTNVVDINGIFPHSNNKAIARRRMDDVFVPKRKISNGKSNKSMFV